MQLGTLMLFVACTISCTVSAATGSPTTAPTTSPSNVALEVGIAKLKDMSMGTSSLFDSVEATARPLLLEFPERQDQGRIYAELAEINAQCGSARRSEVLDYSRKALADLDAPLSSRMEMYLYLGSALDLGIADEKNRRRVATSDFTGLAELSKISLAELPPPLPAVGKFDAFPGSDEYKTLMRLHRGQVAAHDRAVEIRKLIRDRSALVRKIAWLYRAVPNPHPELEELGHAAVPDLAYADSQIAAIEDALKSSR